MDNDKYLQGFIELGIKIEPLPSNYSPEEFGRRLMSQSHTEHGVSYAASTDYITASQRPIDDVNKYSKG